MDPINHPEFKFIYDAKKGSFSLSSDREKWFSLGNMHLAVYYSKYKSSFLSLQQEWDIDQVVEEDFSDESLGRLKVTHIDINPDKNNLRFRISFSQALNSPLFFWRVRVINDSNVPVTIEWIDLLERLDESFPCTEDKRSADQQYGRELAFFSNGWQSWSRTAAYGIEEKPPRAVLSFIENAMASNSSTPRLKGQGNFASDFFGVLGDRNTRKAFLAGFLSQKEQFGSFELRRHGGSYHLRLRAACDNVRLDPGKSLVTDWAVLFPFNVDNEDPLGPYLEAVAGFHGIRIKEKAPVGWCSWYEFFTEVKAKNVLENLDTIKSMQSQLPLDLVQLDDGYQTEGGDWFSFTQDFPQGLKPLVEATNQEGFTPGLWIAPLIANVKAKLIKDHPEYFLKNKWHGRVSAGFISNKFANALDISYPEAQKYIQKVIRTAVEDWGYPYLKLDFLYAGALKGEYKDKTRTRAQLLRESFSQIREAAGSDTFILGCGAPLGSSLGLFDGMRIGADVDGFWAPKLFGIPKVFSSDPQLPSARNAIQNILTRAFIHRRWWINDPDCLLVRADTELNLDEVHSLATVIGMSGGAVLLSDDLPRLPEERIRISQALLPVIGKRPRVLDWFDQQTPQYLRLDLSGPIGDWSVLAWFNWSDETFLTYLLEKDFHLEKADYQVSEFWSQECCTVPAGEELWHGDVPAHGVVLLAVRKTKQGEPSYLGSNLHFSQGFEVTSWKADDDHLEIKINPGKEISGHIDLFVPFPVRQIKINDEQGSWEDGKAGVIRVKIPRCSFAEIKVFSIAE